MKDPEFLFLIGAARSGTKFLRDTLGEADGFSAIPFDVNFLWRRGNEGFPHDELGPELCDVALAERLRRELSAKGSRLGPGVSTILEKTVSNALRIPFVFRAFPEARYIFLVRDGKSVVESSARVWNDTPPLSYRLRKLRFAGLSEWSYLLWYIRNWGSRSARQPVWGPRYEGIEADLEKLPLTVVCARQWVECNEAMLRDVSQLPEEQIHHVRYEDLVRDDTALREVCEFARIPDPAPVIDQFRSTVKADNNQKYRDAFSPDVIEDLAAIMNPTLRTLGYEPLPE